MASFCCGYGEAPPRAAGWPRLDASRFINARESGQVAALAWKVLEFRNGSDAVEKGLVILGEQ